MVILIPLVTVAFWAIIAVMVLGVCSTIAARLAEGTREQSRCQVVFVVCLLLVAVSTLVAMTISNELFLACGATLSLMAVGATLDLRSRPSTNF